MTRYPQRVQEQLDRIASAVDNTDASIDSSNMRLLVAALRALGFVALHAAEASLRFRRDMGPWVDIESPASVAFGRRPGAAPYLAGSLRGADITIEEVEQQNLLARARLLPLLEEFYERRQVPITTRLIVRGLAQGWSRLMCQGAEVARLPERSADFPVWLEQAQAEMDAFAEFLCTKTR